MSDLWPSVRKPVLGMVHLLPLPGSPRYGGGLVRVRERALSDADALVTGGVHALLLENFGDAPFYPRRVPAQVVSCMTMLTSQIRDRVGVPVGVNVLRNDGRSALAIALASGASFIRVNVLCGARVTDQGVIEGIAHLVQRDRATLGASHIKVFADVAVKHSSPLGEGRPIDVEATDTIQRGLADAVIVTGSATGAATSLDCLRRVKAVACQTPVLVGSGVNAETIGDYLAVADGVIVGTAIKRDGFATNPVDLQRVRALMERAS